jgi:hypothetical protein
MRQFSTPFLAGLRSVSAGTPFSLLPHASMEYRGVQKVEENSQNNEKRPNSHRSSHLW